MTKHFVPKEENKFEENLILSGIVKFGREAYADCCDIVKQDSFGDYLKQVVFGAMGKAFGEGAPITITSVFQRTGLSDDRYPEVKALLSNDCFDIKDIRPAAVKLRKVRLKEDAILIHRRCIENISNVDLSDPSSKIIACGEKALFDLIAKASGSGEESPIKLKEVARELVNEWMNNPTQNIGLPLPWPRFNASIGGGLRAGVALITARLKTGKSSLSVMTAVHAATLGVPVLILDTEMSVINILPRILANMSEVEINIIEKGLIVKDEFKKKCVFQSLEVLEQMNICHKNVGGFTFEEIISTIRRWIYSDVGLKANGESNPCLIIFDYFKVMNAKELTNINESQALGFQITQLVDFSTKFNFPCLAFCQSNRDGVTKEDSTVVSSSDKLAQLGNSLSIFKPKTEGEIIKDGVEAGNRKMITVASRYGGEVEFANQYIPMNFKKESCILTEVNFSQTKDKTL